MHEKTGEVRPVEDIPEAPPSRPRSPWSEPFHRDELVKLKGLTFRIAGWSRGRLRLKLYNGDDEPDALEAVEMDTNAETPPQDGDE